MKQYKLLLTLVIFLMACQFVTQPRIPTSHPTDTSNSLLDPMSQTFSGVSVIHRESFEFIQHALPPDWQSDEGYAILITQENQLEARPTDNGAGSGTIFYFSGEQITPNTGVYFTFRYTGTTENFTLGLDNIDPNGERVLGDHFRSVAMEMKESDLLVYGNQGGNQIQGSFTGNLTLQPDTWYDIALAHDNNHNFIIKIWDPNNPQQQLMYFYNWKDFPTDYYFISWMSAKRSLLMDNFTVFKFDEIIPE